MLWVNNESQCYVADGSLGTREVSNGTLKLKVRNVGEEIPCTNLSKTGVQHPDTRYVAGRICSKNRREFVKGRWTARLRLWGSGEPGMFPAWWILGAQNNEPPVQEPDENVPWPSTGSGEIDIFEHHGESGGGKFTTGAIRDEGNGQGDWRTLRTNVPAVLDEWHEYSVEWAGSDLVYRLDGVEVHRNPGQGDSYPEPMFAILNYAKISDAPMQGEWVMEVDWVKHESWDGAGPVPDPARPGKLALVEEAGRVVLTWEGGTRPGTRFDVHRSEQPGLPGVRVAFELDAARYEDTPPPAGRAYYYSVVGRVGSATSPRSEVVHTTLPTYALPGRVEAEAFTAKNGAVLEDSGDEDGTQNLGYFEPGHTLDYLVRVEESGAYTLDYRVATLTGSAGFEVLVDGRVVDRQRIPPTGGWQTYSTLSSAPIQLEAGERRVTVRSVGVEWNFNWFAARR
ncbi:MAG: carbohydrate-binding protein [Planctomycetota bacterium]